MTHHGVCVERKKGGIQQLGGNRDLDNVQQEKGILHGQDILCKGCLADNGEDQGAYIKEGEGGNGGAKITGQRGCAYYDKLCGCWMNSGNVYHCHTSGVEKIISSWIYV